MLGLILPVVILGILVYNWILKNVHWSNTVPDGPPAYPIIGSPMVWKYPHLVLAFNELHEQYGKKVLSADMISFFLCASLVDFACTNVCKMLDFNPKKLSCIITIFDRLLQKKPGTKLFDYILPKWAQKPHVQLFNWHRVVN